MMPELDWWYDRRHNADLVQSQIAAGAAAQLHDEITRLRDLVKMQIGWLTAADLCTGCGGNRKACDRARVKCCPDCTHKVETIPECAGQITLEDV